MAVGVTTIRFANAPKVIWVNIVRRRSATRNVWTVDFARHRPFARALKVIKDDTVKVVNIAMGSKWMLKRCNFWVFLFIARKYSYLLTHLFLFTGICEQKCLNGGKCIQKDKCQCTKGFYGPHCEFCEFYFNGFFLFQRLNSLATFDIFQQSA